MYRIGMPKGIQLGEATELWINWAIYRETIGRYVYPTLKVKADL